jgi:hypothetical protein
MGLGGDAPAATDLSTMVTRCLRRRALCRAQNTQAATETYKQAADAYRRAGDIALANGVLAEARSP